MKKLILLVMFLIAGNFYVSGEKEILENNQKTNEQIVESQQKAYDENKKDDEISSIKNENIESHDEKKMESIKKDDTSINSEKVNQNQRTDQKNTESTMVKITTSYKETVQKEEQSVNFNQPKVDKPQEQNSTTEVKKEEKTKHYNYDIGNSGLLFDSEAEAMNEAEKKFNDCSDPEKYVCNYVVYSTYDKWSVSYYYSYY